jgi:CheY-like chemotaxis protein
MSARILIMDDQWSRCYPNQPPVPGLEFQFAESSDPIQDGLATVRCDEQKQIRAVISDCFEEQVDPSKGRSLFWHIEALRKARPDLLIVVHSGGLTEAKIAAAACAGADRCVSKGKSLLEIYQLVAELPDDESTALLYEEARREFEQHRTEIESAKRRTGGVTTTQLLRNAMAATLPTGQT